MAIALPMQLPLRSRRQTRIAVSIAGSRVFRLCRTARRRTWWRWLSSRASARRACLRSYRDARARDRALTHRRGPHRRWIRGRARADRQDPAIPRPRLRTFGQWSAHFLIEMFAKCCRGKLVLAHFQSHASAVSSFELCRSLATSVTTRSATSAAAAATSGAIDAPAAKDAPSTAKTIMFREAWRSTRESPIASVRPRAWLDAARLYWSSSVSPD